MESEAEQLNIEEKASTGNSVWVERIERVSFLFFWLRWFYPRAKGYPTAYQLMFFFRQKVLRFNGAVPWPVHFTSRVLYYQRIRTGNRCTPGANSGCYIQARNGIEIGHNLRMGPNVGLISANHSVDDYDQWDKTPPIRIGNNVWIGMNAVVLPGVAIGDNVVIAANSVVNKDIPSDSIAGGVPCKVIRAKEPYTGETYD